MSKAVPSWRRATSGLSKGVSYRGHQMSGSPRPRSYFRLTHSPLCHSTSHSPPFLAAFHRARALAPPANWTLISEPSLGAVFHSFVSLIVDLPFSALRILALTEPAGDGGTFLLMRLS